MAADWTAIANDYITGGGNYADLAKRYNLSPAAVARHGSDEHWGQRRRQYRRSGGAVPATDARRLLERLLALTDRWAEGQDEAQVDLGELRKAVQCAIDLVRELDEGTDREIRVVMDVPEAFGR